MAAHALIGFVHSRPRGDWRRVRVTAGNTVAPRKIGIETFFRGRRGESAGSGYK